MSDFTYDIVEKIGVLSESGTGWKKEFNKVSWNQRPAKFDIRDWAPDNKKMSRGISLTKEEIDELKKLLDGLTIEN